jgi:hypothetical protein
MGIEPDAHRICRDLRRASWNWDHSQFALSKRLGIIENPIAAFCRLEISTSPFATTKSAVWDMGYKPITYTRAGITSSGKRHFYRLRVFCRGESSRRSARFLRAAEISCRVIESAQLVFVAGT